MPYQKATLLTMKPGRPMTYSHRSVPDHGLTTSELQMQVHVGHLWLLRPARAAVHSPTHASSVRFHHPWMC
jgi:hypothetical protein